MQYARLGSTGLQVSRICLGTMSFGNSEEWMVEIEKAKPIVQRALDLGINFFDTANVYSNGRSEEIVGELLKDQRDDVVIRSEEHTSELQSQSNLVCRLLLEKKKQQSSFLIVSST